MQDFLMNSGIFGWLICLIIAANLVLITRNALGLRKADPEQRLPARYRINALLFWGAVAALLGFLGQYSGIYIALNALRQADKISPHLLAEGVAISFSTTIMGMFALLISTLAWFVLRGWHRRKYAAMEMETA